MKSIEPKTGGSDSSYEEEVYRKPLSREETLERQTGLITFYYSKGDWDSFEYAIKAMFPLLPKDIRDQLPSLDHNITRKGVEDHYQQFITIQELLESDTTMLWNKRFIKTFE